VVKAFVQMNEKLSNGSFADDYGSSGDEGDVLWQSSYEALPNCNGQFSYSVSLGTGGVYEVEVTGTSGQAERKVNCSFKLKGPFEAALLVERTLVMKPGSTVEGFNFASAGEKLIMGTLSILDNQIILGGGVFVDGDVVVGVGGDPSEVISAGDAVITGSTYAMSEEFYLPEPEVPEWLDSMPSQGTINSEGSITTSGKYDGISLGKGDEVIIDGPVTLYVTGDIGLSNSAQLQINNDNPNASLTLYMGGNLYCKNGGEINNRTKDSTRLKIFGLDDCTNLSFGATAEFYGAILAPEAEMNLKSSVEIYGSVLVKIFNQGSTAGFHYDAALRKVGIDDDLVRFVLNRWQEQ